jgi:alkylhydroperoxidase family enzyme
MARIEPLTLREFPKEMRGALAAMTPPNPRHTQPSTEGRPKALNTLGTFAHHPELAKAYFTFNGHLLMATTLSERQRELLVLRVSVVRDSGYEWIQHVFIARDVGLDDDEISRVTFGPTAPFWDELDAAILRSVDELIVDGEISASTWKVLAAHLDVQQILDLIFTVGSYDLLARMFRSFELEIDQDIKDLVAERAAKAETM